VANTEGRGGLKLIILPPHRACHIESYGTSEILFNVIRESDIHRKGRGEERGRGQAEINKSVVEWVVKVRTTLPLLVLQGGLRRMRPTVPHVSGSLDPSGTQSAAVIMNLPRASVPVSMKDDHTKPGGG